MKSSISGPSKGLQKSICPAGSFQDRYRNLAFCLFFVVLSFGCFLNAHATTKYWVGSAGGNFTSGGNWSLTSGGGGGAGAPGASDVATFDGGGNTNCTLDNTNRISVAGINIMAGYTATITPSSNFRLFIGTGGYTQASGVFNAPDTMTINGSNSNIFIKGGGTFNPGTGLITFSGWQYCNYNVNVSETFYNVKITSSNLAFNLNSDVMIVTGTLTLESGVVNTGTIDTRGNTIQQITFGGGSAVLDFGNDGISQTLTANGGTGPTIRLDSPADAADAIVLNSPSRFGGLIIGSAFGDANTIPLSDNGFALTLGPSVGYNQASGIFNAPPDFIVYGSNSNAFIKSGGTFNEGTGQVTFSGWQGCVYNVGTSETFYNVKISSGELNLSNQTMIVTNTLTLEGGDVISGTIDTRRNTIQQSGFGGGNAIIDFGDDGVVQTYTVNGGYGPIIRFDSPADASDAVVMNSATVLNGLVITAGFGNGNTVPFTYNGNPLTLGFYPFCSGYSQASGIFNAPANLTVYGRNTNTFIKTGGIFNEGTGLVTFAGWQAVHYNVDVSETFYNVKIASGDVTLNNDIMLVTGNLTLEDGTVNTGVVDTRQDIIQQSTFDGGSAFLDFGDNSVIQTYTANGGRGPIIRFDDPSDANDVVVLTAASAFKGISITSGFGDANTVPFTYNNYALTLGFWDFSGYNGFNQASGIFNAPANLILYGGNTNVFMKTGGTFNEGTGLVTFTGWQGCAYDVNITETLYNVTIASGDLNMNNDILLVQGALNLVDGTVNTGTVDTKGNTIQEATFDGGSAFIDFGENSVSQTYTAKGGYAPIIRFDNPADASDMVVLTGATTFKGISITAGFGDTNVVPFTYNGYTLSIGYTIFTSYGYNQASGIFNAPPNMVLWGGNTNAFIKTGGTFNEGTGLVTFTGWQGVIYNVISTETFYDVKALSGELNLNNDFLVTSHLLTLEAGAANTGTLEAQGNVVVKSGYAGGNATLLFTGTNVQTFDLTGATGNYNGDITTNKTGGQATLLSALVMDAASQDLTIQQGTFDLTGQNLTVNGTSGTMVGKNTGNFQLQGDESVVANTNFPQFETGSTVTYDGTAGPYILKNWVYHHLTINGTGGMFNQNVTVDVNGDFTLLNGTLSPGSNNMTVAGSWINSGGTYVPGTSTVTFDGTAAGKTITSNGSPFYNLSVSGTGGEWTPQDPLTVSNLLFIQSGTLIQESQPISTLTLSQSGGYFTGSSSGSPADITVTGSAYLCGGSFTSTKGTLSVGGDLGQAFSTFNGNSGTISFAASSPQSLYTQLAVLNNVSHTGSGTLQLSSLCPWVYCDKITISPAMVSNTSQSNFPVLIKLSAHAGLRDHAQANFNDVLFTSSDKLTKIPHEIESYNKSTGDLLVWVKVPVLSVSGNTIIFMYYGNPYSGDQRNLSGVWDASFKGDWHLPNGTTLSATESTSNGNNGTLSSPPPTAATGKVDGGASFAASTYITLANNNNSLYNLQGGDWTTSVWLNPSSYVQYSGIVIFNNDGIVETKNNKYGIIHGGNVVKCSKKLTTGAWVYLTAVKSGSNYSFYFNGVSADSLYVSDNGYNMSNFYYLGRGYSGNSYQGIMDEPRVSNVARSTDWIVTEYRNQNDPLSYETLSPDTPIMTDFFMSGNLVNASGTFDASLRNIFIAGNWSNSGTFIPGTKSVTLNGTSQQVLGTTTFNDMAKTVSASNFLGVEKDKTTTITGNVTLMGAGSGLLALQTVDAGGNLLNDGSQATFDFKGTTCFDYLDVHNNIASSSNSSVSLPVEPSNSLDGQNNINWWCNRALIIGSNGFDGTYQSLTNDHGAFQAINAADQAGKDIVLRLGCSSQAETGTYSLNAGNWSSLTIYPVTPGVVITGNSGGPFITLDGADRVTIDGRLNQSGSTPNLTFCKIRYINTAVNNTLKYCGITGDCNILGNSTLDTDGAVTIGGNLLLQTNSSVSNALTGTITVNGNATLSP
jgi:hypothetical protein